MIRLPLPSIACWLGLVAMFLFAGCASQDPKDPRVIAQRIKVCKEDGIAILRDVSERQKERQYQGKPYDSDYALDRLPEAEKLFQEARKLSPESYSPAQLLCEIERLIAMAYAARREDFQDKINEREQAQKSVPKDIVEARNEADARMREYFRRSNQELENYLNFLMDKHPWQPEFIPYYWLAENNEILGDYSAAMAAVERFLKEWKPKDPKMQQSAQQTIARYQQRILEMDDVKRRSGSSGQ